MKVIRTLYIYDKYKVEMLSQIKVEKEFRLVDRASKRILKKGTLKEINNIVFSERAGRKTCKL